MKGINKAMQAKQRRLWTAVNVRKGMISLTLKTNRTDIKCRCNKKIIKKRGHHVAYNETSCDS